MASAWRLWALCAALAAAGAAVAAAAGDDDAFARYRAPDPVALLEEEEAHAATAASVFFKGARARAPLRGWKAHVGVFASSYRRPSSGGVHPWSPRCAVRGD